MMLRKFFKCTTHGMDIAAINDFCSFFSLLRTVFFNKDENVIRATLKRLPAQYVPNLIDELTLLTNMKTAK